MSSEKRQFSTILFADIAGYSTLMQLDESRAGRLLLKFKEALKEQTVKHNGKIINFYGDGCLAVFEKPVDAVKCAGSLQFIYQEHPKVPVRIGLHAGEIIFKEDNVYGDNVNIASRVESIGVPGAVLFSEEVKNCIENKNLFKIVSIGKFDFKNIKRKIRVYALGNKGFVVPRKRDLRGKLSTKGGGIFSKVADKTKTALAVLGVLALLITLNFSQIKDRLLQSFAETSLLDKKVAVMSFENETGDEKLNSVGKMASDWITQQLMDIKGTKVVLPSNVHNNMHLAKASLEEGIQTFAKATGAAIIINGRYYQSGENLILQAQVVNVLTGEIIHTLEKPIIGDKSDPLPLIQDVSQRITGFWAVKDRKQFTDQPPKLLAYQEYLEGRKYWGIDYEKVNAHYLKAFELDSNFIVPIVELVAAKINESSYAQADSLLEFVTQKSDHLSKAHQLQAKAYKAQLAGNLKLSLIHWEKIYEIDSKEFITVTSLARQYLNTNQPKKALKVLKQFEASYLDYKECLPCQEYYELLTYAHFQLGNLKKVISIVEGFDFPVREGLIANYYLKSLVHLGEFDKAYDKLGEYLGEDLSFNGGRQSSGLLLVGLLFELQKVNQTDISKIVAGLLINYGEDNYKDWLSDYYTGMGYYGKGKYDIAAEHFANFQQKYGQVPMALDLGLASLAACKIHLKEHEALDAIYKELDQNKSKYASSHLAYAKAKIEAQLGHKDKAIALLKESIETGQEFLWFKFQNDPFLESLFLEEGFLELINEAT